MLRSPQFVEKVSTTLSADIFDRDNERWLRLIWTIALDWWEKQRSTIPRTFLEADISSRLSKDASFMTPDEQASLQKILDGVYAIKDDQLSAQIMAGQVQLLLNARCVQPAAEELTRTSAGDDFDDRMQKLIQAHSSTRISTGTVSNIFTPGTFASVDTTRILSGVPAINSIMCGGWRAGEVVGLLGPFGGGKTTLGVQAFVSFAKLHHHSLYMSYELDIVPELSNRMYGLMAEIPMHRLVNLKPEQIREDDKQKIYAAQKEFGKYMHVVDMKSGGPSVGSGGAGELAAQLREYHQRGEHIDLVVLDQYLPMVNRYMAAKNISEDSKRLVMQSMVLDFMSIAQPSQMNCTILLLHQSNTEVTYRNPTVKPAAGDSAECKSFPFWMSACLALGRMDEKNVCWLTSIKQRGGPRDSIIVKLAGDDWMFFYKDGRYAVSGNKFVDRESGEDSNEGTLSETAASGAEEIAKYQDGN
jgi:hypothetical protein